MKLPEQTQPFWCRIEWGSEQTKEENDCAELYQFATEGEMDAFLEGVDEASGWMDYEVVGRSDD